MDLTSVVAETQKVTKTYRSGKIDFPALRGVTFRVHRGEFCAIAGSSGSGKTTLLNCIGCIDVPTEGEVLIGGTATAKLTSDARAQIRLKNVGFVFQTFNLIPTLTALENVEYPLYLLGESSSVRRARSKDALNKVGLKDLYHRKPSEMSGGQRQRVAIARAIVKDPLLVLADEPTANLDKETANSVLDLMHELNHKQGMTFVFSSHDPKILTRANRVFRMIDGNEDQVYYWPENNHAA